MKKEEDEVVFAITEELANLPYFFSHVGPF
jgi:hypothetical protein